MLAFTDADCVPQSGWLSAGMEALRRLDLAQGRVVPDPDAPAGPFDRTIVVDSENGLYETATLLIRRDAYSRPRSRSSRHASRPGPGLALLALGLLAGSVSELNGGTLPALLGGLLDLPSVALGIAQNLLACSADCVTGGITQIVLGGSL